MKTKQLLFLPLFLTTLSASGMELPSDLPNTTEKNLLHDYSFFKRVHRIHDIVDGVRDEIAHHGVDLASSREKLPNPFVGQTKQGFFVTTHIYPDSPCSPLTLYTPWGGVSLIGAASDKYLEFLAAAQLFFRQVTTQLVRVEVGDVRQLNFHEVVQPIDLGYLNTIKDDDTKWRQYVRTAQREVPEAALKEYKCKECLLTCDSSASYAVYEVTHIAGNPIELAIAQGNRQYRSCEEVLAAWALLKERYQKEMV